MPRKEFESFTRLDASDVNTYLMDQSVMTFGGTAARGSAIPTPVEGMVAYLEDSNTIQAYNSTDWVTVANAGTASFNLVETIYFTSSGSFTKATYPWLRAIKVTACGGGGGAGGAATTGAGQIAIGGVGAGGAGSITFINDISSLDASVTVTVGAGGSGGAAGNNNASAGGNSSFGTVCVATGGGGGEGQAAVTAPIAGGVNGNPSIDSNVGDLTLRPGTVQRSLAISATLATPGFRPAGGESALDKNVRASISSGGGGANSGGIGIGGNPGGNSQSSATARAGGDGANGIVILELYA
jgi:hypothetical protein